MDEKNVRPVETRKPPEMPKILVKPLPQILDELEDSIRLVNDATRLAAEAAKDARQAAEEARKAGEKAAGEAARVAAEAIAKVDELARAAMSLGELVKQAVTESATAAQARLAEWKEFGGESRKKKRPE